MPRPGTRRCWGARLPLYRRPHMRPGSSARGLGRPGAGGQGLRLREACRQQTLWAAPGSGERRAGWQQASGGGPGLRPHRPPPFSGFRRAGGRGGRLRGEPASALFSAALPSPFMAPEASGRGELTGGEAGDSGKAQTPPPWLCAPKPQFRGIRRPAGSEPPPWLRGCLTWGPGSRIWVPGHRGGGGGGGRGSCGSNPGGSPLLLVRPRLPPHLTAGPWLPCPWTLEALSGPLPPAPGSQLGDSPPAAPVAPVPLPALPLETGPSAPTPPARPLHAASPAHPPAAQPFSGSRPHTSVGSHQTLQGSLLPGPVRGGPLKSLGCERRLDPLLPAQPVSPRGCVGSWLCGPVCTSPHPTSPRPGNCLLIE